MYVPLGEKMKRLATPVLLCFMSLVLLSGTAYAAVQTKLYSGLYAYGDNDNILAEIDRTTNVNNKVVKDTSSADGDHMRIEIPFRDRAPSNGKSVHASVDWKKHAQNCGINGIDIHVTGGGISTACNDEWQDNGHFESNNVSGSGWWFVKPRKYFNGTDNTLRGGIHVCQAQWNSDPCSGRRWVTTFW